MATPWMTVAKYGSAKNLAVFSGITSATEYVSLLARIRAARLGTYPSFSIAALTAAAASGVTLGESFTTRETVDRDTPAAAATISREGCVWAVRWIDEVRVVVMTRPSSAPAEPSS